MTFRAMYSMIPKDNVIIFILVVHSLAFPLWCLPNNRILLGKRARSCCSEVVFLPAVLTLLTFYFRSYLSLELRLFQFRKYLHFACWTSMTTFRKNVCNAMQSYCVIKLLFNPRVSHIFCCSRYVGWWCDETVITNCIGTHPFNHIHHHQCEVSPLTYSCFFVRSMQTSSFQHDVYSATMHS